MNKTFLIIGGIVLLAFVLYIIVFVAIGYIAIRESDCKKDSDCLKNEICNKTTNRCIMKDSLHNTYYVKNNLMNCKNDLTHPQSPNAKFMTWNLTYVPASNQPPTTMRLQYSKSKLCMSGKNMHYAFSYIDNNTGELESFCVDFNKDGSFSLIDPAEKVPILYKLHKNNVYKGEIKGPLGAVIMTAYLYPEGCSYN